MEVADKNRACEERGNRDKCSRKKIKSDIYFSFSVHSVRVPVALRDKEWSRFRLMTCLRSSTKSVQMLCMEKMTLLTSTVSFLSTAETPSPYYYTDTPTELYHADENLSPLNLIKVFSVISGSNNPSPPPDCPFIPHRAALDDFISYIKVMP